MNYNNFNSIKKKCIIIFLIYGVFVVFKIAETQNSVEEVHNNSSNCKSQVLKHNIKVLRTAVKTKLQSSNCKHLFNLLPPNKTKNPLDRRNTVLTTMSSQTQFQDWSEHSTKSNNDLVNHDSYKLFTKKKTFLNSFNKKTKVVKTQPKTENRWPDRWKWTWTWTWTESPNNQQNKSIKLKKTDFNLFKENSFILAKPTTPDLQQTPYNVKEMIPFIIQSLICASEALNNNTFNNINKTIYMKLPKPQSKLVTANNLNLILPLFLIRNSTQDDNSPLLVTKDQESNFNILKPILSDEILTFDMKKQLTKNDYDHPVNTWRWDWNWVWEQ